MTTATFVVVVGNVLIFGALGAAAIRTARRDGSPRIKALCWAFTAVCSAFVLGALTRLVLLAVAAGWVDGSVADFLESEWVLIQALAVFGLGLSTFVVVRRIGAPIRRADQIVTVLTDRFPEATQVSELGLTARELEVLEVIVAGTFSDRDIAEALYISPATAGTHVKNILRKAGAHNRRDLVLLAAAGQ